MIDFFLKQKALSDAQLKLSYLECNRISNWFIFVA